MGIQYIKGCITNPVGGGIKVIAHICNEVGVWYWEGDNGVANAIDDLSAIPKEEYYLALKTSHVVIGDNLVCPLWSRTGENELTANTYVINMIANRGVGGKNNPNPLSYIFLSSCLDKLKDFILEQPTYTTVHLPKIEGDWGLIERFINATLVKNGIDVFVYSLEDK